MALRRTLILLPWALAGIVLAQTDGGSTTGLVPDESVLPQWSATFPVILGAREDRFQRFKPKPPKPQLGPLSDEELINGRKPQPEPPDEPMPKLQGAEDCQLHEVPSSGSTRYVCFFAPLGSSADDMQSAFVSLVRLVEKATGGTARQGSKPYISPTMESRLVSVCGPGETPRFGTVCRISVEERWLPNGLKRSPKDTPMLRLSRLWVEVFSDPPPNYHPPSDQPLTSASGPAGVNSSLPIQLSRSSNPVGANPSLTITNASDFPWQISFSGAQTLSVSLAPRSSQTVTLAPGNYFISGSTSAPNVIAFAPGSYTFPQDVTGTFTITVR
jgi:hypothetical protein